MGFFFYRPQPTEKEPPSRALSQLVSLLRSVTVLTLIILALWLVGDVITVVFAAALMSIVLHGLARLLRKYIPFIPYTAAVGIVVITILGLLTALIWSNGPAIGDQFISLKTALITQSGDLSEHLSHSTLGRLILDHLPTSIGGNDNRNPLGSFGFGLAGSVTGFLSSAFGLLGTLFVVAIAAFYFAISPSMYINGFLRLFPPSKREATRDLLFSAGTTLWAWTSGQALDMFVVGCLSGLGLSVIGVPLALALGVVAGLCNFIPYIGAIMGAVPALIISLSVSTKEAFLVAILYTVIQFFEGNVLAPLIQRRAVHMPPAIAILSQTVFSSILGVPGLVLASPITAALLAVFDKAMPPLENAETTQMAVSEISQEELDAKKKEQAAQQEKDKKES